MKISNALWKKHEEAEDILWGSDDQLTKNDIWFVLKHWNPNTKGNTSKNAAFFTPINAAHGLITTTTMADGRMLDLGAGIGRIVYWIKEHSHWQHWNLDGEIIALEINPEYVKVGKRLFPDVTWICGDMFDYDTIKSIGRVDNVLSNPPFGRVQTTKGGGDWLAFSGEASLMAVEVAMRIADRGAGFILPSVHVPFEYSGKKNHKYLNRSAWSSELRKFYDLFPGVSIECSSYDMSVHKKEWDGTSPETEVVSIDTSGIPGKLTIDTKVVAGQASLV